MAKQPAKGEKTPAKSRKTPVKTAKKDESIKLEAVIDPIPPEVHTAPEAEIPAIPAAAADDLPDPAPALPEFTPEPEPPKPVTTPPPPPPQRKGGFFPLLLGGLLAGVIGYGIATLSATDQNTELSDALAAQSERLTALQNQVAELPTVDLSRIEETQVALTEKLNTLQTDLLGQIDALDARMADLESLPVGDGTVSDRAIAAYEADLEALRADMAEMTGSARAQLDEARAEAAAIEENAAAAARAAAGRAALARIQTSLDNGEPLGAALGDLEAAIGEAAPDALLTAQDGVPTLAALQESFLDVAPAALAAAREAGVAGEETSGLGAFLKNQFEVRSTTPREGNSTDAILSRAEAALKAGRLSDSLAEIAALPEEARVEMTDWLGMAESRAAAAAAIDVLSTSFNDS